jgi:pantothenate kinase
MMSIAGLAARARALVVGHNRAIVGITGSPGAGKTTLAQTLVRYLRETSAASDSTDEVAYLPMDGFHLADRELDRLGIRGRKGAPDTFDAAGYAALLRRVRADHDEVIYAPSFERELEQPLAGSIPISPDARLIITEGNYLLIPQRFWRDSRAQLDEVWYCDLADGERVRRLVRRHELFGKSHDEAVRWVSSADQSNADLISQTKDYADLVLPDSFLESIGDYPAAVTHR